MDALPFLFGLLFASSAGEPYGVGEHGRRPARIEPFWHGLGRGELAQPAAGIVALRSPLEARVRITGGRFVMGSTLGEMQRALLLCHKEPLGDLCEEDRFEFPPGRYIRAEGHAHEVTLSDFEIDRLELSVGQYSRCVSASACAPPSYPSGDARFDRADLPVTHVRWEDAMAYCKWVGGRLPTEAEWEHAARGRSGKTFPWGEIYNPRLANHGAFSEEASDARDGYVGLAPVGSFPDGATASGLLDMAGNVAEWVIDWLELDEEGFGYRRAAQVNPTGPVFGLGHIVRGGSYRSAGWSMRTAARNAALLPSREIGFRCAYDRKDVVPLPSSPPPAGAASPAPGTSRPPPASTPPRPPPRKPLPRP